MASAKPLILSTLSLLLLLISAVVSAEADESTFEIAGDTLSQYETEVSFYDEEAAEGMEEGILHGASTRRSLFWGKVMRYYISYGALSANRIPCPPRSGRSYYTHNCYRARGPVHPYTRGCSAITRCRR
ncbi:protein RALF-like 34 [Dorcoceras hygrometricum]|uniref:Protein RALF-like 34 n=1 Tax=Dorcoceras hygrometricum TaxID=472368 RepID=A0A2Z7AKX9_9LAMI|nr:protein RALF-like 34 [Dorcoceras hygrometricum]KZV22116.1 protein RALF-like 34 [Dorcoceras hygrometricum]